MNYIPKIEYDTGPTTIQFELPPEGDNLDETYQANVQKTVSSGGVEQSQWNYNEHIISPNFVLIPQAIHDQLLTFFLDWASKGKAFKYYESSDEAEFFTVTLSKTAFKAKKVVCDGMGGFLWDVGLDMRRTL